MYQRQQMKIRSSELLRSQALHTPIPTKCEVVFAELVCHLKAHCAQSHSLRRQRVDSNWSIKSEHSFTCRVDSLSSRIRFGCLRTAGREQNRKLAGNFVTSPDWRVRKDVKLNFVGGVDDVFVVLGGRIGRHQDGAGGNVSGLRGEGSRQRPSRKVS